MDEGQVDLVALERAQLHGLIQPAQIECDGGIALPESRDAARQHLRHRRGAVADAQRPELPARRSAPALHRALRGREDAARLLQEGAAGGREANAVGDPLEEIEPEIALEARDRGAQGLLRHVQALSRPRDVLLLRHCHKVPQMPQLHAASNRESPAAVACRRPPAPRAAAPPDHLLAYFSHACEIYALHALDVRDFHLFVKNTQFAQIRGGPA